MSGVDLKALVPGRRYRVTFDGVLSAEFHPAARQFKTTDNWHPIVGTSALVSVEDVADPLPTKPGTRFWGKTDDREPQWWFVQETSAGPLYVPSTTSGMYQMVAPAGVEGVGLVRLPDPEPQP